MRDTAAAVVPRAKTPPKSIPVYTKLRASLEWMDENEGGTPYSKTHPPKLYIDGETVIEEVVDLTVLRRGYRALVARPLTHCHIR